MTKNFELLREEGTEPGFSPPTEPKVCAAHSNGSHTSADSRLTAHDEEVKLAQRVFLLSEVFHTVVFCAVEPDKAASAVSARTAEILAAQGAGSVCVVDADIRGPGLHRLFGVSIQEAPVKALFHSDPIRNYVQKLATPNLWLLPCRAQSAELHSSLSPDWLRRRVKELRVEFDYVLIHAPAVSVSADAVLLGQVADGLVLIVRANSTRREIALQAKESLQAGNVTLLGAVLNRRRFPIPEALYRML